MSFLTDAIQGVAPVIAGLLGGPLAGTAVAWLGKALLGDSSASVQDLTVAIKDPAILVKLKELENQIPLALMAQQDKQSEVNKVEAASASVFVSGWRPAIGWTGALGLIFNYVVVPISHMFGLPLTNLDMDLLMPLIIAMLGLGTMRTVEKVRGTK